MAIIGAVTDDFTGAASAGVLVAKCQAKTGLFFDAEAVKNFEEADRLDAIYVSSNSRHLLPNEAHAAVEKATCELQRMGIQYFSKKIDTTLRGGIGYEIDAMLQCLGKDTIAVMVTAMPQSRRICVGGYSIIDGVILTETPVAQDVKTPVKECYVPALVQGQSRYQTELINLRDVLQGEEILGQKLVKARENGSRIIIVDAMTMENIDTIAKTCVELQWNILSVDPGPFTMKLAYHRGIIGEEVNHTYEPTEKNPLKTALLIVGSANPSTMVQIDRLCAENSRNVKVSVSPYLLLEGGWQAEKEVDRVCKEVISLFKENDRPQSVIVETALHGSVVNLEEEDKKHSYKKGTSSDLINQGLAHIADQVLECVGQNRVAGLLLTGGDTMECVCRRIQASCIQAVDNIVAQVDVGRIIGKYNGLPVIVKGGFCGNDDIEIDIVNRLFAESKREGK